MQAGEVEANLLRLNESFRLAHVNDLVQQKLAGPERSTLDGADFVFHQSEYERLREALQSEFEASRLPEFATGQPQLNDLLIRLRMR